MKTFLLSVFAGVALVGFPLQAVLADDDTTTGQAPPATGAGQGKHAGEFRAMFQQLDLTDAQKAQIKQIRQTMPAGKERRQQIIAVLNPDQKAKLMEMMQAHRGAAGAASGASTGGSTASGNETPATSSSANANTDTDLPPP
jgi:Spy/CpxP family protein refolding chaperone